MKLNGLEHYFKTNKHKLIVNFKQLNNCNRNPLMLALSINKSNNLNLNNEQFNYIIKKSDLKQVDDNNWNALMYALKFNKIENLNLNEDNFNYLIKNSNLKQINYFGADTLAYALHFKQIENLTKNQLKYLIENSDLSLIRDKEKLQTLKKIQSELINDEILSKIDIKENIHKKVKI